MSSILTNSSAMVALQTLRGISSNLTQTQSEIATGKSVASAKDNAAIWAISKVMESDVNGFKAISASLSLGESSVSVARQTAESVSDLLTDLKGAIVAAQEENVDRSKIQADINAMRDQITSIVNAAQINGMNLVQGTETASILGSLDRASDGSVTASKIDVSRQDLTSSTGVYGSGTDLSPNAVVSDTGANALNSNGNTAVITVAAATDFSSATATFTIGGVTVNFEAGELGDDNQDEAAAIIAGRVNALGIEGVTASSTGADVTLTSARAFEGVQVTVSGLGGVATGTQITAVNGAAPTGDNTATDSTIAERAESVTFSKTAVISEGDGYRVTFAGAQFTYVAGPDKTFEDIAKGLQAAIGGAGLEGVTTKVATDADGNFALKIDNSSATDMTLAVIGNAGGEASGGLFGIDGIDVTTDAGAAAALANIETFIDTAIDAAAAFGSDQGRIELQSTFISKLTDSLRMGIGSLVDADMEEASARLQALQVQQQLGIQSLSIANQAPQSILSLFQ